MKSLLIALLLTSSPTPIEPGYVLGSYRDTPHPPIPEVLKAMGARWEMDYKTLRRALLQAGWVGSPREYSLPIVEGFPEVNCGQGWQAVCWSVFRKGEQEVSLLLHPTDVNLLLIGASHQSNGRP